MSRHITPDELDAFLESIRSVLTGKPHGVLLSTLVHAIDGSVEGKRHSTLYMRVFSWSKLPPRDAHGLGFWQFGGRGAIRVYLRDEPFEPPPIAQHQAEVREIRYSWRRQGDSITGETGGFSRIVPDRLYQRPRTPVHHCEQCMGLPHRRPEDGSRCLCGRTYRDGTAETRNYAPTGIQWDF